MLSQERTAVVTAFRVVFPSYYSLRYQFWIHYHIDRTHKAHKRGNAGIQNHRDTIALLLIRFMRERSYQPLLKV